MTHIVLQPSGKRVMAARGTILLDVVRKAGIELKADCGGLAKCGQCVVRVASGLCSAPTEEEIANLAGAGLAEGYRLACCCEILDNCEIDIPRESTVRDQRLLVQGHGVNVAVGGILRVNKIRCVPPSPRDDRSDLQRVLDELKKKKAEESFWADMAAVRQLPLLGRRTNWHFNVYVRGQEVIGFAEANERTVGLAVDLGTTKIAGYLLDMETGEVLAAKGLVNPQVVYGEDVIARIGYACSSEENTAKLSCSVRKTINQLAAELTGECGLDRRQIAEACLAGNTVMTHLFLNLPVTYLGKSPFAAVLETAADVKARDVDLDLAPGAYLHTVGSISGFIGGDHVAMIIATQIDSKDGVCLGVDIGTNTEIILNRGGQLTSISCASGPAFEGAHIRDGMRAAAGAIEAASWSSEGFSVQTIGNATPIGICGSGMIALLSELTRVGLINAAGHLQPIDPAVRSGTNGLELVVVSASKSGTGKDIVFTQEDISQLQLAKAAIHGGIETLLEATDTDIDTVEELILAGAFGSFLHIESAVAIGLLVRFPYARYVQVGNAAGSGARMALVSRRERERAAAVACNTTHLELQTHPNFKRNLTLSTRFPKWQKLSTIERELQS